MPLLELISRIREPESTCMFHGEDSHTYSELMERSRSLSGFLRHASERGDRIGILSENGFDFVTAYLGCMHSGRVAVPINTTTYSADLGYVASDCGINTILTSRKFHDKIRCSFRKVLMPDIPLTRDSGKPPAESDLAALMYTSGSTGKPVAVKLTHRNILSNTSSILDYLGLNPHDRVMVVLPFHYCYGASLIHTTLVSGGCLVINNSFMFPQKVVDEIVERRCTVFAGVPSTYKILMTRSRLAEADTSCLRYALQAGGRLPPSDIIRLKEALPGTQVVVMYGQTEATTRLSYLPADLLLSKLGSIGRGIPGVELRVLDRNGNDTPPGETGEIVARGDNISPGYWNNPEETSKTFRDGWLHTGDMARKDEEGYIYLVGRTRDFVKVAGNRFSSVEVEDIINEMDGVDAVAAVGVPDDLLGESLHTFVVPLTKDIKEEDIINTCRKRLPSYKVPSRVTFLRELPMNSFGKVQKFRLPGMQGGG